MRTSNTRAKPGDIYNKENVCTKSKNKIKNILVRFTPALFVTNVLILESKFSLH